MHKDLNYLADVVFCTIIYQSVFDIYILFTLHNYQSGLLSERSNDPN